MDKYKKRVRVSFWLIAFISYVTWCPRLVFGAKAVSGVLPNPPPLFEVDPGIKPNLSGSIQNAGRAVLPGEEGTGTSLDTNTQEFGAQQSAPSNNTVLAESAHGTGLLLWWLLPLIFGLATHFGYRRWRRGRGK